MSDECSCFDRCTLVEGDLIFVESKNRLVDELPGVYGFVKSVTHHDRHFYTLYCPGLGMYSWYPNIGSIARLSVQERVELDIEMHGVLGRYCHYQKVDIEHPQVKSGLAAQMLTRTFVPAPMIEWQCSHLDKLSKEVYTTIL
jgi:hypothetical protein